MRPHRVAQPRPQLLDELGLVVVANLVRRNRSGSCVTSDLAPAVLPRQDVTGLELAHLAEDRQRPGNGVEREERVERVEVDLAARKRPQLGCERDLAVGLAVVERLDPVRIASEHQPPALRVPERDREHPAQPLGEALAVLLVQVHEHLGVAARREPVPGPLELEPELAVVVELAVLNDRDPAVLVRDRLVARREVDDGEAPGSEADAPVEVRAVGVRPALDEGCAHRREPAGIDGAAGGRDSADPAHASLL